MGGSRRKRVTTIENKLSLNRGKSESELLHPHLLRDSITIVERVNSLIMKDVQKRFPKQVSFYLPFKYKSLLLLQREQRCTGPNINPYLFEI